MVSSQGKRTVVIVGGGPGGVNVARLLSTKLDGSKYNLILVDKRAVGIWLVASLRVAVSESEEIEKSAFLPYDRIFSKGIGEYVQGSVNAIEVDSSTKGGRVILENGQNISFDILVLASGSIWPDIIQYPDHVEEFSSFREETRSKIKKARDIIIAGGGAVGIELSGEIKDVYPNKNVTIVQGGDELLNDTYSIGFRKSAHVSVSKRGVNVILNDFIDQTTQVDASGKIKTRHGQSLDADLILRATGPRPNTSFIISSLGDSVANSSGYVKVKKTLQLVSHSNIFAVGDIIDIKEQKQAGKASNGHAPVVADNVVALLDAGEQAKLKDYGGVPELIVVTNGKNGGRGYIPFLWGIVLGDWFSRFIKAKSLLTSYHTKPMGY